MKLKIAAAILTLAMSLSGNAKDYKIFSTDDGLTSSLVKQIFEDSASMVWIATEDGLNRYDGSRFTQYLHDPSNPNSLASNYVNQVFEDSRGRIFIVLHPILTAFPLLPVMRTAPAAVRSPGLSKNRMENWLQPARSCRS